MEVVDAARANRTLFSVESEARLVYFRAGCLRTPSRLKDSWLCAQMAARPPSRSIEESAVCRPLTWELPAAVWSTRQRTRCAKTSVRTHFVPLDGWSNGGLGTEAVGEVQNSDVNWMQNTRW